MAGVTNEEGLTPTKEKALSARLIEPSVPAGVRKRVHAHGLRHAHPAERRAEGVGVAIITRQLGHESLLTTIRYPDHIAATAVVETIAERTAACP